MVKELLRIRLQATKASTSKYKRILQMEVGGRMYGTLQFCAANRTGRWGGRGLQPQNLPRPTHKFHEIEAAIEAFKAECEDFVLGVPPGKDPANYTVMAYASSALRSVIVAAPGKKLVVSDLSNIEGRMLAFLAGEEWKLEAFRKFDRGEGPDLYKVAYARSFNIDPNDVEDDSDERQIGKVQELALGYQGGVNAYVTMSATYGVDLDAMAAKAWDTIPAISRRDAQGVYAWATQQKRTLGLSERVYVVCEALKALWRAAHPETCTLWELTETACKNAIENPKVKFKAGKLSFFRDGNWLYMRLPSGRLLCYPNPKVEGGKISYMGVNVYNKRWHRIYTYGGKLIENADQAASRDKLAYAMPRAEAAGYWLVLDVHDELMAEVDDTRDDLNDKGLSAILSQNDDWDQGLPLAAKGMTTKRYRKG
jgi:DNA polymerase